MERILEIEAEVRRDVIAFLTNVNEHVGDAGRHIHVGMTSSDVLDTGLALQLKRSVALLRTELMPSPMPCGNSPRPQGHRNDRSPHAIHGEPITFGFKIAGWLAEAERNRSRLERLEQDVAVGQISGAMGTYANTDPQVEAISCEILGLTPDTASTQVISRDRHADYVQTLALVGASLDRFSTEIRTCSAPMCWRWRRTLPARREPPCPTSATRSAANGSAAWPGVRSAVAALENVALWHERDISHSSTERMMLPDCSVTLHFMLREMTSVVKGLGVYPDNMRRNMNVYGGVVFSQRVLLALVGTGMSREEAYRVVQRNAHTAWNTEGGNFRANLEAMRMSPAGSMPISWRSASARAAPGQPGSDLGAAGHLSFSWPNRRANRGSGKSMPRSRSASTEKTHR